MIQYEDIDRDDMLNYWGRGRVFLDSDGFWNSYTLVHCTDSYVTMKLDESVGIFGTPEKTVKFGYNDFFRQAMLHRPSLGVLVENDGSVYALGWQHANGHDMAKGLRDEDVYVYPLIEQKEPKNVRWEGVFEDHVARLRNLFLDIPKNKSAYDNDYMDSLAEVHRSYTTHPINQVVLGQRDMDGTRQNGMSFVARFLNQERSTVKAALKTKPAKPVFIADTAWLLPKEDGVFLMSGPNKIAYAPDSTGVMGIIEDSSPLRRLASGHFLQILGC